MKQSRFSKVLSLLLAVLMVLSLTTPATVSAAQPADRSAVQVELNVNETKALKVSGWYRNTTWTSSDPSVVTVDSHGVITAEAEGTATVTAVSTPWFSFAGGPKTTTFAVTVTGSSDAALTVKVNEELPLSVNPDGGTVTWTSSDEKIAVVSPEGVVKGVQPGDVTVTAEIVKVKYLFFGWVKREIRCTECFEITVLPADPETPNIYTVTFESNGGSAVEAQQVEAGKMAMKPAAPTRDNYEFAGWYTDTAFTNLYDFQTPVTADVTLYAKWDDLPEEYSVVFESNGGTVVFTQFVEEGQTVQKPEPPIKSGYIFAGWYADAELTVAYDFTAPVTGNLTLYAKWDEIQPETYTVTFESNGGSAVEAQQVEAGRQAEKPVDPEKTDYIFNGWYTDPELTTEYDFAAPVTRNLTLYAKWDEVVITYTVTYETNGGSSLPPVQVAEGMTLSAPEDPIRDGFVFTGWYTNPEFTEVFLFDSDTIHSDMTLYASWEQNDADYIVVDYIANQLRIEYEKGDNANHVTQNIVLPSASEEYPDAIITWSSSSDTITADGIVTRPLDTDEVVTLTATVQKNNSVQDVQFQINVVHISNRNTDEIPNNSVIDIENMNPNHDSNVSYAEDKSHVISIDGKYTDIIVNNADDALDAIQSVHTIIGIDHPHDELNTLVINNDEYGTDYTFEQHYNGHLVIGRRATVSVDANGITDSLSSGLCPTARLAAAASEPQITAEEAKSVVSASYGSNFTVDASTELVYYALDDRENNPVLAYELKVSGSDDNGEIIEDNVWVSAVDGTILAANTNIITESAKTGSGKNERNQKMSFPVAFTWTDYWFYYMKDLERDIEVYHHKIGKNHRVGSEFNHWTNESAVSAYTNIITAYDWYKNVLGRDSVDDAGTKLHVTVQNGGATDNAFWRNSDNSLNFGKNSSASGQKYTYASCVDVAAHEYTHGVVHYVTGGLAYRNATGAINEGYADIFGCFVDGDWKIGEDREVIRDASNPTAYHCPDKMSSQYFVDYIGGDTRDHGGVHTNSSLVYYAAYLMEKFGISRDDSIQVWYQSLSMGYDNTSTFQTVRRNVLKAARRLQFSDEKIKIIKKAFDAVEIYGERGTLNCTVKDEAGNVLPNAQVVISRNGEIDYTLTTDSNGRVSIMLDEDIYNLTITAEGYLEYTSTQKILEFETNNVNAKLIKEGHGSISGLIVNSTSGEYLANVTLKVRTGFNATTGDIVAEGTSDASGSFAFDLDAGYYTIEMKLAGFTDGYLNVLVQGDANTAVNGALSPIMESNMYRIVLRWGTEPRDLDSHLKGTVGDTNFHIYYADKTANMSDGTEIGNLDLDDTSGEGPETTTFVAQTDGSYYFYVYRYSSSGSLPASGATVEVYNGDKNIANFSIDASASSNLRYWNVFKIENGIFSPVNTVTSELSFDNAAPMAVRVE